jgi:O-antigen ligase
MTIEKPTPNQSTWLLLFIPMAMLSLFNAGFDHDILFAVAAFLAGTVLYLLLRRKNWDSDVSGLQSGTGDSADSLRPKTQPGSGQAWLSGLIRHDAVGLAYAMFVLYAALSLSWSIFPIRTVIEWIQLVVYGLFLVVARKVGKGGLDKFFTTLFLVSFGVALLGVLEYVLIRDRRIQSTFTNPNPFGMYVAMIFLLSHGISLRKSSKGMVGLSLFFLTTLLLTGSRAAIAAMALGLVVSHFGLNRKVLPKALLKTGFTAGGALAASQLLLYLSRFLQDNFSIDASVLSAITRENSFVTSSLTGRLEFWRVALASFRDKPVGGYGLGTFFSSYYLHYGGNGWYSRFTHNHYLQVLAELGVVGGLLFLGFLVISLVVVVQKARNQKDEDRHGRSRQERYHQKTRYYENKMLPEYFWGMAGAMLAFLAHIFVDFTWNFPAVTALFFVFLGLTTRKDLLETVREENPVVLPVLMHDGEPVAEEEATAEVEASDVAPRRKTQMSTLLGVACLVMFLLLVVWHVVSNQFYMRAIKTANEGDTDKALAITQIVNRMYPLSTFGHEYACDLLVGRFKQTKVQEDLQAAKVAAKRALTLSPLDAGEHARLANINLLMGNEKKAEQGLLDAIALSTYHIQNDLQLSQFYMERGRKNEAVEVLEAALERVPHAFERVNDTAALGQIADNVAVTRILLYQLYHEAGKDALAQEQIDKINLLMEIYPSVGKYFEPSIE